MLAILNQTKMKRQHKGRLSLTLVHKVSVTIKQVYKYFYSMQVGTRRHNWDQSVANYYTENSVKAGHKKVFWTVGSRGGNGENYYII